MNTSPAATVDQVSADLAALVVTAPNETGTPTVASTGTTTPAAVVSSFTPDGNLLGSDDVPATTEPVATPEISTALPTSSPSSTPPTKWFLTEEQREVVESKVLLLEEGIKKMVQLKTVYDANVVTCKNEFEAAWTLGTLQMARDRANLRYIQQEDFEQLSALYGEVQVILMFEVEEERLEDTYRQRFVALTEAFEDDIISLHEDYMKEVVEVQKSVEELKQYLENIKEMALTAQSPDMKTPNLENVEKIGEETKEKEHGESVGLDNGENGLMANGQEEGLCDAERVKDVELMNKENGNAEKPGQEIERNDGNVAILETGEPNKVVVNEKEESQSVANNVTEDDLESSGMGGMVPIELNNVDLIIDGKGATEQDD